jgi:hypothetical protein
MFLGQEGIQAAIPAGGGRFVEVGDGVWHGDSFFNRGVDMQMG